jgi:Raf kinase inhibitor-like YbhB/YbcL family protein/uncharacterized protein (TIGR00297 family)
MSFFILQPSALILALFLALIVASAAYFARALSLSGAIAAALVGTLVFGFGGWPGAALLLTFFVSSSLFSRLFGRRKQGLNEKFSKGSRRDAGQVLANGGLAALFAVLHGLLPEQGWVWAGFAGSLAAVNADTWATELGVLSRGQPRLISTGQPVERGASGGVTLTGTLAALAGAALIGLIAVLFSGGSFQAGPALILFSLCGLAGSLVDSLLGATVQAIYFCPTCQKETERHPLHTCGTVTTPLRGKTWLNNDWVNVACALTGLALASVAWFVFPAGFTSTAGPLSPSGGNPMSFPLSSTSFDSGSTIPQKYTCDGDNRSPALNWSDLPSGTFSLALIAEDPDAPSGTFTHWVLYNLPPTISTLPEGLPKTATLQNGAFQGVNDFRKTGYDGPCPPPGAAHRYTFKVFALDIAPTLPGGMKASELQKAIQGHVLGKAEWVGKFGR